MPELAKGVAGVIVGLTGSEDLDLHRRETIVPVPSSKEERIRHMTEVIRPLAVVVGVLVLLGALHR